MINPTKGLQCMEKTISVHFPSGMGTLYLWPPCKNIRGVFLSYNSRKHFFHWSPPLDEGNSNQTNEGPLIKKSFIILDWQIQKSSQCVLRIQMWSQNTITNRNHFIIISTRKSIEYLEILDDSRIIFQPWNWSVLLDCTLIRAVGRFENPRGVVMSRAYSAPPPPSWYRA